MPGRNHTKLPIRGLSDAEEGVELSTCCARCGCGQCLFDHDGGEPARQTAPRGLARFARRNLAGSAGRPLSLPPP